MRKKLLALLLMIVMLSLAVSAWAGFSIVNAQVESDSGGIKGRIIGVFEAEKTPENLDSLSQFTDEERQDMAEGGWVETENSIRLEKGLPGVTVSLGEYQTITDQHGNYSLTGLPAGQYVMTISIRDEVLVSRSIVIRKGVVRSKDIEAFHVDPTQTQGQQNMGAELNQGDRSGSLMQSYIPCNDCNGPYGNCGSPGHVIGDSGGGNFWGSDCFWSLVWLPHCVLYHTSYAYCNGSRNCSPLIGHSTTHHCH